ncbi:MAG: hypothetical protein K6F92_03685 [Lachnospiraceae bacterium]|nr:hypothetical protein [Lachnospiraceae bacterium]
MSRKKRLIIEVVILMTIIAGLFIYAFWGRKSHTDKFGDLTDDIYNSSKEEESMDDSVYDNLYVCQCPVGIVGNLIKLWEEVLPQSPYIITCTVIEGQEPAFGGVRAKVKIETVHQGEGLKTGDEIYITNESWLLRQDGEKVYVEFKFHNLMKPGEKYLLFLSDHLQVSEEVYGDTYEMDGFAIAPVFLYEDRENKIVESSDSYVSYKDVRDNEVYFSYEEDLKIYLDFKKKLFEEYPFN